MSTTTQPAARNSGAEQATTAVLSAAGIVKSYKRGMWPARRSIEVLRGTDLALQAGEVVGLVGENGSGKSTLMKILVGALAADAGTVTRTGSSATARKPRLVYPRLTCDEHFGLFAYAYGIPAHTADTSRQAIYQYLGFTRFASIRADQLSGDTLAKLNLGLALLADPQILLLDEPYAGFDFDTYQRFWELVATRRAQGRTVLIISHFVVDEERFDRIIDLHDGETVPRKRCRDERSRVHPPVPGRLCA